MTDTSLQAAAGAAHQEYESAAARMERRAAEMTGPAAIKAIFDAHSVRLDIVRSTVRAFKAAVENHTVTNQAFETYYFVNLLEAIEGLIPADDEALRDFVLDKAHDMQEQAAAVLAPAAAVPASSFKRARREATIGSAA